MAFRGLYLIAPIFTTLGLLFGFYSILFAINHHFNYSVLSLLLAILADSLDGSTARLFQTENNFRVIYDSICDVISFGAAPAIIVYTSVLSHLEMFGHLISFFYVMGTAIHLARFIDNYSKNKEIDYFQGFPCPLGASILIGTIWFLQVEVDNHTMTIVTIVFTIFLSVLQISPFRWYSFKNVQITGQNFLLVIFYGILFYYWPLYSLVLTIICYILSGPVLAIWFYMSPQSETNKNES